MKKSTIKAFTLVEMLIVIVIIGILIASLMPRMQTAQWRARDVARKNDLSQIQTAIITSQADRGAWPGMKGNWDDSNGANSWKPVSSIKDQLLAAWMSEVPSDPNGSNNNFWLWSTATDTAANLWQYLYLVSARNWVSNAWFVLMAKTEVEWSSNWVVCTGQTAGTSKLADNKWHILSSDDLANLKLCSTVSKVGQGKCASEEACKSNAEDCCYAESWELRYILVY